MNTQKIVLSLFIFFLPGISASQVASVDSERLWALEKLNRANIPVEQLSYFDFPCVVQYKLENHSGEKPSIETLRATENADLCEQIEKLKADFIESKYDWGNE